MAVAPAGAALLVAEAGGKRLLVVDEAFAVAGRIEAGEPVVALAAFDPPGAAAYALTRDGRVLRIDLARGRVDAEMRAGREGGGLAASADGRYLAVALVQPGALVVLDRDLRVVRELTGRDLAGGRASPVTAVCDAPLRRSFVAALPGLPEVWEVSYDDAAEPIHPGLVHDYRYGEGIAVSGKHNARRAPLATPLDRLDCDPYGADAIGWRSTGPADVVNLLVRRRIATLPTLDGVPPRPLARWREGVTSVVVLPADDGLRFVAAGAWREDGTLALGSPARRVRTQESTPLAWIATDQRIVVLAKSGRRIVAEIVPGGRIVDLSLARGGAHVHVLTEAALLRLDARTLAETARVAFDAPATLLLEK